MEIQTKTIKKPRKVQMSIPEQIELLKLKIQEAEEEILMVEDSAKQQVNDILQDIDDAKIAIRELSSMQQHVQTPSGLLPTVPDPNDIPKKITRRRTTKVQA